MTIKRKKWYVALLSSVMALCVLSGAFLAFPSSASEPAPTVINPIAKYEFKDKTDLGKDSMGNYHMEYRRKWVANATGDLLNTYTSVDEVNGGVTFDGSFCVAQDAESNMFADVTAFTLCFEIKTANQSAEWAQYLGVGNSSDFFAFIGRKTVPGQMRLHTFNMYEWEGVGNIYNIPKVTDGSEAPTDYQKVVVSVQPGGNMLVYLNGSLVSLVNSNKSNQAWDTSISEDWATGTDGSFFAIGGRYNGAVDRTSTGSIRNVQFYDFAMDATCVSAYNTNGQVTTSDTVNLAKVTGLKEVVFDGEPTKDVLKAGMTDAEILELLNSAEAKFNLSNDKTVTTPITWTGIEKEQDTYYAVGSISSTKLGYINSYGTEVRYQLTVVNVKSLGTPVFAGEMLKGEIKDTMSEQEMLALVNDATVLVTFMDDSTEDVSVTFSEIKMDMGNYSALAKVIVSGVNCGTVSVAIPVTGTNEGPMKEVKPIALWKFDSENTKLADQMGNYELQAVPKANGDMTNTYGMGVIDNGALYLDGNAMLALPINKDVSEDISNGFTLNFQYKQDGIISTRSQPWAAPVSFGAEDFGSGFGAGFLIADESGDLRIQGYNITKNVTNGQTSMYWTDKVVEGGENVWHNVTLSVRPGQFFNCYVDGVLKYSEVCPENWSLKSAKTTFSIGGRVMWNNGYNTFKGWIDNVSVYAFAQSLEQSNAYWSKAKIVMQDMAGEIITSIASTPTFENGVVLSREVMDNMYDKQVVARINPSTVNAVMDSEDTIPLQIDWKGYKRESGVWYIYGYVDAQNVGYVTTLTGKVEIKVQIEVTRAPRLITIKTPKNGTVTTESDKAYLDDQVVITVTPDKGYKVSSVKVNGSSIFKNDNGQYVYLVEDAEDIEIVASFVVDENAKGCGSNFMGDTVVVMAICLAMATVLFIRKKHN